MLLLGGPKPLSSGRTEGVRVAFGKCDYYAFSISNHNYSSQRVHSCMLDNCNRISRHPTEPPKIGRNQRLWTSDFMHPSIEPAFLATVAVNLRSQLYAPNERLPCIDLMVMETGGPQSINQSVSQSTG